MSLAHKGEHTVTSFTKRDRMSGHSPTVIQTDKGMVRCSQFDTHLEGLGARSVQIDNYLDEHNVAFCRALEMSK